MDLGFGGKVNRTGWLAGARGDGTQSPVSRADGGEHSSYDTSVAMTPKVTELKMCQDRGCGRRQVGGPRLLPTHNSAGPVQKSFSCF